MSVGRAMPSADSLHDIVTDRFSESPCGYDECPDLGRLLSSGAPGTMMPLNQKGNPRTEKPLDRQAAALPVGRGVASADNYALPGKRA